MPFAIACPQCHERVNMPNSMRGQSVHCPKCQHAFLAEDGQETIFKLQEEAEKITLKPDSFSQINETYSPQKKKAAIKRKTTVDSARPRSTDVKRIGRFEIRELLGKGAYGRVYLGWDPQLERDVAIKFPRPSMLSNEQVIERFLVEGKAAGKLQHPNIVEVLDAGQQKGQYYLASAFIKGQTLGSLTIGNVTQDNFRRIATVIRELADALGYAHQKQIVHRDVKPANVMIDEEDHSQLMDFGLAHRLDGEEMLTMEGEVLGTPAYMAPEQAKGQSGKPIPESDQYSLGVILYELLCGTIPFKGTTQEVLFNVIHSEPTPPRKLHNRVPRDLETICLKAMSKEPKKRYVNCQAMAEDLRRWLDGEPIHARRLSLVERAGRFVKKQPMLSVLLLLIITSMIAVGLIATSAMIELKKSENEIKILSATAQASAQKAKELADQVKKNAKEVEAAKKEQLQKQQFAVEQQRAAEKSAAQALARREKAKQASMTADAQTLKGRKKLYDLHMELAKLSIDEGRYARAEALLQRHIPTPGMKDLRDPEWHYRHFSARMELPLPNIFSRDRHWPLAFSVDHRKYAFMQDATILRVQNVKDPDDTITLPNNSIPIWSAAFLSKGNLLITGGEYGTVHFWDLATKRSVRNNRAHSTAVVTMSVSDDETVLLTGSIDGTIRLWDLELFQSQVVFDRLIPDVLSLAISKNKSYLAAGSTTGSIFLYRRDVQTPSRIIRSKGSAIWSLKFSPDGRWLASGDGQGNVEVREVSTGKVVSTLTGHQGPVRSLAFQGNGTVLASGDLKGEVRLWHTIEQAMLGQTTVKSPVYSLQYTNNGKTLSIAEPIVDTPSTMDVASTLEYRSFPMKLLNAFVIDQGNLIALHSSLNKSVIELWDTTRKRVVHTLKHPAIVDGMHLSPNKRYLITRCGGNRLLTAWDLQRRKVIARHREKYIRMTNVTFSHDSRMIAVHRSGSKLMIFDLLTGKLRTQLNNNTLAASHVQFSYDNKLIATSHPEWSASLGSSYGTYVPAVVQIWNLRGKRVGAIERRGYKSAPQIWFHPNRINMIIAAKDSSSSAYVQVVNLQTTQLTTPLDQNNGYSHPPLNIPKSNHSAVRTDRGIVIWDRKTGKEIGLYKGTIDSQSIGCSLDGKKLIVLSSKIEIVTVENFQVEKTISLNTLLTNPQPCINSQATYFLGVTGSTSQVIDLEKKTRVATLTHDKAQLFDLAFGPKGIMCMSIASDGIKIWYPINK